MDKKKLEIINMSPPKQIIGSDKKTFRIIGEPVDLKKKKFRIVGEWNKKPKTFRILGESGVDSKKDKASKKKFVILNQNQENQRSHPILPGVEIIRYGDKIFSHQENAWACGYCAIANGISFSGNGIISAGEVKQGMERVLGRTIPNEVWVTTP